MYGGATDTLVSERRCQATRYGVNYGRFDSSLVDEWVITQSQHHVCVMSQPSVSESQYPLLLIGLHALSQC